MARERSLGQESMHTTFAEMLDHRDYERTQVPKMVGNYRLGKTLGAGAYCKVKMATHVMTKEKFAIKILQPQAPQNWVEVEREIEILQQIQHPNIIRIHEVLWSENGGNVHKLSREFSEVKFQGTKIYIVVELAQGGELWEHISVHGPVDEDMARRLFRQLVSGLEYCHMHLICHRDLKLENILLDKEYNVKINDFGLSNFIHPGHSMHTFCGTLAYAAPEILSQQAYVGFFVDIWSLGIILFAMLTGDVPWALDDEDRKAGELRNLLAGKFRLPGGVALSHDCISLLQIMLQPNPKNRATLAQIRTHNWTNKGYNEPPPRVFENYPRITELDEAIISQIALLGLSPAKARRSILNNEPCPALCLYHTLLKKQIRSKKFLPPLHRSADMGTRSLSVPPPGAATVSSAPPSPSRHAPIDDFESEFNRKLDFNLATEELMLDPLSNYRTLTYPGSDPSSSPTPQRYSPTPSPTLHPPTTPTYSPPSPTHERSPPMVASPVLPSLTSPRSTIAVRRKLSANMQLEPLPQPPPKLAEMQREGSVSGGLGSPGGSSGAIGEDGRKRNTILQGLFKKFTGGNRLTPLEV